MNQPPGPFPSPDRGDFDLEVRLAYLAHAPAVHRHAVRAALGDHQQAEDATQEAFMAAIRNWSEFRSMSARRQLAWLSARARWRVIDSWRAASAELPTHSLPEQPTPGTAEDTALSAVTLDRFWKAVTAMPARAARAAYLRWHEDWTATKIADHLGVDRATVLRDLRTVITAAQEQLADELSFPAPATERRHDALRRTVSP